MSNRNTNRITGYWQRAFCRPMGLAALTAGLAVPLALAHAQDAVKTSPATGQTAASQDKSTTKSKTKTKAATENKGAKDTGLHVVPIPRQNRPAAGQSKAAAPPPAAVKPAGPPITTLPNAANAAPGGGTPNAATFTFDFHGTDIDNVLKFYSTISNLAVTKDPGLTGPVTIISPKPVTLDEAFKVLQSVLAVRGFTALQDGNVLTIVPLDRAIGSTTLLSPDVDPATIDKRDQVMTQVIPLENVDAEAMANELKPLINKGASLIGSPGTNSLILTDTASNVRRFIDLVDALDGTVNSSELRVFPLKRAEAGSIADIVNNLYKQITTRGRGAPPQPGQPPPQPQQPGQPAPLGNGRAAVVAVADTRTNSVIVVASVENTRKIAQLISRLDGDDTDALDTKIRPIKFADAVAVANLVNSVLSNMHGSGGGGQSGGSPFQQRVFGGFGFDGGNNQSQQTVNSTDPFGKVVPDPRTNSVLITASTERMAKIDELIDQLDVNVPTETTTFVFPLKNAQADDVATALSMAFNTQQQNNSYYPWWYYGGNGNNNSNGRRQPNRRLGQNNNNGRAAQRIGGPPPGPPNAPDGDGQDRPTPQQMLQNALTPDGSAGSANGTADGDAKDGDGAEKGRTRGQFYYGDYYYGGRRAQVNQQYGRGREGGYSNLLRLQNNVFITAAPGGDSVIITTNPENYQAIKDLIDALDVVPRQVMIEAIVAEVTLDADEKLGLNLAGKFASLFRGNNTAQSAVNLPASGFTSAYDPLATGAQFVINGTNYSALLQALTTDNKVKVLSTPSVFTSNNQEGDFEAVTQIPYVTSQQASSFINTTVGNDVRFLNVGFILHVTPRITRQGYVTMDIEQEASDLLRFDIVGTGTSALREPVVNDRYTNTSVSIHDGDTVAIGGLIRDSKALNITKVPLISEIPLIGQFFRSRETVRNKVELVIFLTPHIINSADEAREMTLKQGRPVIHQIPDLSKQQPNLVLPDEKNKANGQNRRVIPNQGQPGGSSTSPSPGTQSEPPNPNK